MIRYNRLSIVAALAIAMNFFTVNFYSVNFYSGSIHAQEITYLEDFALAEDREKALEKLVPGTEPYYYFHCLHYQNSEQYAEVEKMIKPWIERFGETRLVQQIQNRQALLLYPQDNQATLDFLRRRLNLSFSHQRQVPSAQRGLPTSLDQNLISYQTLLRRAMSDHQGVHGFEDASFNRIDTSTLNELQLRHLLQRLTWPDIANLPELINKDLTHRRAQPFGSYNIHRQLTKAQLDKLVELRPKLLNETNYVNIYLTKLSPNEDVDLRTDHQAMEAYMDRLWDFVKRLNDTHNSLKANVLYRRLDFDRRQGVYDRERFEEYLKFPRQVYYINPRLLKELRSNSHMVNLHADYRQQIKLVPIVNDEPVVRDFLHRFLVDQNDFQEFLPWIEDQYLKRQFATVKILNGLGDSERWASMLTPEEYQALMKRVDLDFDLTNPSQFSVDQSVELKLYAKNVKNLIVKVFEINTANYYQEHRREIDTNINLDGLVPNWQESHEFSEPPLRRVARTFQFDQIDHEGVYIIDFIGNGKSSRALIRKGKLHNIVETTLAGPQFTILDENNRQVNDATIWVAGNQYEPADDGTITIPFSTQPGRERVVISRGSLSSIAWFQHPAESYHLTAGIFVDREALLRGGRAPVVIRPQLKLAGQPVSLDLLTDISLVINATDLDDVSTSKEVKDLALDEADETVYEFLVPARLHTLQFEVKAKVKNISQDTEQAVAASQAFQINGIDESDAVQDMHLRKTTDGYRLAIRGKTGEAREGQPVLVILKHRMFTQPVHVNLRSDEVGQVDLGELADIVSVEARLNQHQTQSWQLSGEKQSGYSSVHALTGQSIQIPFDTNAGEINRETIALFERRGSTLVNDFFESVTVGDGLITIQGLTAGDYQLFVKPENRVVQLRVTEGHEESGYAIGAKRNLEIRGSQPLHVRSMETSDDEVKLTLGGDTRFARVHIMATRYQPRFNAFPIMSQVSDVEPIVINRGHLQSSYIAGRAIGEEYQYILDRQYASKYPGNMLTRPTLLLNPWAIRTTDNDVQVAAQGNDFGAAGGATDSEARRAGGEQATAGITSDFSNLDFLADSTVVLASLRPDENGVVTFDREMLGEKQMVRIVVEDPLWSLQRDIFLPDSKLVFRDLRLSNALDPDQHFAQRREYSVLKQDESFELKDMLSSKFQHYDDLGDVYRLFMTLSGNSNLAEFGFIMQWPNLSDDEKYQLYSKYACHELHFFLMHKDPEFFADVVEPYLAHKLDSTYLDQWLVNSDLTSFVQPWEFQRLNVVEQALLGRRISGHQAMLQRRIEDAYDLNPTDVQVFSHLYDVALKSSALDESGVYENFERARDQSLKQLEDLAKSKKGQLRQEIAQNRAGQFFEGGEQEWDQAGAELQLQMNGRPSTSKADTSRGRRSLATRGGRAGGAGGGFAPGGGADFDANEALQVEGKEFYREADKLMDRRQQLQRYYRRLKPTQEFVENNYYHLPLNQQNANLVLVNRYWRDFARHNDAEPFLSPYFAEATGNFTEMMLALAVLDLPFEAPEHRFEYTDNQMNLTPASDLIAFYQEVRPAIFDGRGSNILVSENFFRKDDRYRNEDGKQYDKFVTNEFLTHVLYGGQVVITNPTSTPQSVELLIQIPAGSIPASGSQETQTVQMDLNAFSSQTMEYYFYFPVDGQYPHYPAHVSIDNLVSAVADPLSFNVVQEPSEIDTTSWEYVSQNGSDEQVLEFLRTENLLDIDLSKIAFRMKEKPFFEQSIEVLQARFAYDNTLWSYGIRHNDVSVIRQYLKHADSFVANCGKYLECEILSIDPIARLWHEHREYWPLVNARAHQLGPRRTILNNRIWQQYHSLLEILSCRNQLSDKEHLIVAYYMLLQDRIAEGLGHYHQVNRDNLETQLQYDYCSTYVALYKSQPDRAAEIAKAYEKYPVKRWREMFAAVNEQVNEIQSGKTAAASDDDQAAQQTALASQAPSFDFKVESRKASVQYQNIESVQVNYYKMDIELLFSRNPFVQQQNDGFAMIRPNLTQNVALPSDQNEFAFDLPEELSNSNVLVEISAAGITKSQAYYAHSLNAQTIEQYGQLHVTHLENKNALSKVYVKVYARKADGSVHFYKDGYTDLRGRFDYASLSNQKLDDVERFSMLILSDDHGAVVKEANVPKE